VFSKYSLTAQCERINHPHGVITTCAGAVKKIVCGLCITGPKAERHYLPLYPAAYAALACLLALALAAPLLFAQYTLPLLPHRAHHLPFALRILTGIIILPFNYPAITVHGPAYAYFSVRL
jgi:hypothetical protein